MTAVGTARRRHAARRAEGEKRDWRAVNENLVNRGRIDLYVSRELVRSDSRTKRRGEPYAQAWIDVAVLLSAVFDLPLRQTAGFLSSLTALVARVESLPAPATPTYATLCRRRRELGFALPAPSTQLRAVAVDATGITLCSPGKWTKDKYGDTRLSRYVKLHIGVDVNTGEILAAVVTPSEGEGTGDPSVGPALVEAAANTTSSGLSDVLGDGAYDSTAMYLAAAAAGARMLAPLGDEAVRGLHPDRDVNLVQLDRLGYPRWRAAVGYGDRSHVEGAFSALKRVTGERVDARSFAGAQAEIMARVNAYNRFLALEKG
jgi:hypothetical protein